jgi:hypothetical protein
VAANGNNAAIESGKPLSDSQQQPGDPLVPAAAGQPAAGTDSGPDTTAGNPGATGNPSANAPANPSDPQAVLRSLLNSSPNPPTAQQQQQPAANRGNGTITGGGIAGVASIAKGHSIKLVNDQTDFSLWEFYYDLSKEANANRAAAPQGTNAMPGANQNAANQNNTNQSGFGGNNFPTMSNSGNTTGPNQPASPVMSPTIPPPQ